MGLELDPEAQVTVTTGSTEAMMAVMLATCNPGDKLILFSPFYENYAPDMRLAGAEPVFVPLHPPDLSFDPDELRSAFQLGVKGLVLCNPSNPSGKVFSPDELLTIASLAIQYDALVIADEVYEHIVYPPHRHTYIASLPGMFERTISCSSLSKTYSVTGWRLGYAIAPQPITHAIRKLHDYLTLGTAAPLQEAAVTALRFPDSVLHRPAERLCPPAGNLPGSSGPGGYELHPPAGRLFRAGGYLPAWFRRRSSFLPMDGKRDRRCRCAGLVLLPRAGEAPGAPEFCKARRNAVRGRTPAGKYLFKITPFRINSYMVGHAMLSRVALLLVALTAACTSRTNGTPDATLPTPVGATASPLSAPTTEPSSIPPSQNSRP